MRGRSPTFHALTTSRRECGSRRICSTTPLSWSTDTPVRRLPPPPLLAVDGAELALRVRPLVPDADAVVLEVADVRLALDEPQQLVDHRAEVDLAVREQREPGGEIEAHLRTEQAARPDAGAVGPGLAVV
jgi:hypothetical protein